MNEQNLYRRLARRETHRSRSVAAAVVMIALGLAAAYAAIECVLAALGLSPLLVSPSAARDWLSAASPLALGIAGAAMVLGLALVVVAFSAGRRARHTLPNDRMVVVVDDSVIAGAVAREARRTTGVAPERVHADVSRRIVRVAVTPTSGLPIDAQVLKGAADAALDALQPAPRLRARVAISGGSVGS